MVWNGNTSTSSGSSSTSDFSPKVKVEPNSSTSNNSNNTNNAYWNQKRGGLRVGFFPYPRRNMRGGEYFAPRGFPPHQFRKMRPHWVPRNPRPPPPPHFPPESYMPYPPPPWPAPQPPPPPPPPSAPVTQLEADTTLSETTQKKKKKASNSSRPWDKEAAEKAHALEMECQRSANAKSIVIRFPDPELSKEIVQGFHSQIDNVHFQGPCGVRYCFVTLKDEADVDKVIKDINKVKFGIGHLSAERKAQKPEENSGYENIDPFTLYVGNLALNISVVEVKEKFPTATRIDVGHAKRMKNTRYAFVKFSTAEAALEAYKASVNTIMASRSIIVRFRRHKATFGPPGEESSSVNTDSSQPREKLTVGAKLKAKKEKAKAEKAAKEEAERKAKQKAGKKGEDDESEDDVELDNDDESMSEYDMDDLDEVDDDDDDDEMNMVRDSESEEEYELSADEEVDADDDDDEELISNLKEDDDNYFDEDDCKDVFSLTFNKL